ncbi:MAG: hypothetical protein VB131_02370 [Burkholderia gladioli]
MKKFEFDTFRLMSSARSSKKPVLIEQTETEMRVTLAEIARGLLDEPYRVRVFLGSGQVWEIELITDSEQVHQIQTQRGPTRTWLALDKAIEAVLTYCTHAKSISVEIGSIVLESRSR